MKKIILLLLAVITSQSFLIARPQYSILQSFGTKCEGCHLHIQGGGMRNNPGWLSRKDISLINPSSIGLAGFFDFIGNSNQFFDDKVTFGLDFRYQSARWPAPTSTNSLATAREQMIMQATPYLAIRPFDWMELEAQFNTAYYLEENKRYIGQQPFAGSMYLRLSEDLPTLRIGYFQPTIGTKFDDHTYLVRQVAVNDVRRSPLIPDDYAEYGVQLDYENISWLGLSLGVFGSKNLSELQPLTNKFGAAVPLVDVNQPSMALRVGIYPETSGFTTFFGGYLFTNSGGTTANGYFNNYFYIADLFWNIGIADKFAIMAEFMRSYKHNTRSTNNMLLEFNYQLMDPINVFVRGERANTEDQYTQKVYHHNQIVVGTHIFPLPYMDLLVEYRIYEREAVPDYSSQWAVQLHLFY